MGKFGIIGIGWLAGHFADFYAHSLDIWGTSRHLKKFSDGFRERVEVFKYNLADVFHHLPIANTSQLLFTIPPSKIGSYGKDSLAFLKEVIRINPSINIIYISSTSIYGNQKGVLNEHSKTKPRSENAKKIAEVESYLLNTNAYILRCGGLIGEGRHPVYYLSGRQNIAKPKAAVNLVHERDVSRFIKWILKKEIEPGIYNLVCPQHPERKEYYQDIAERLNLKALNFDEEDERKGKIVMPKRTLGSGFTFEYASPIEMPLVRK